MKTKDKHYEAKFLTLPAIINDWVKPYFSLDGCRILDFGCGDGATALGLAINYRPKEVLGIEVQDYELNNCLPRAKLNLGISSLPNNFELKKIKPGQSLVEFGKFDLIYAWSVFEHVDQEIILEALRSMKDALSSRGLIFIQIAPLFYSAFGSHLAGYIEEPWAHLKWQHSRLFDELRNACPDIDKQLELSNCYETLNKITADQLIKYLVNLKFDILREYRTDVEGVEPEECISNIFDIKILMNEQIVILAKKI
jgi:SAM-dependent methyltransferase